MITSSGLDSQTPRVIIARVFSFLMMRVFLCRHGETVNNVAGVLGGDKGNCLTPLGRRQARLLAARLAGLRVDAVYSSSMLRALETAGFTCRRVRREAVVVPEFREMHLGELEGLPFEQAELRHPRVFDRIFANPWYRPRGGESLRSLQARAMPRFMNLVDRHPGENVAVFAHNLVNRVILASLLGIPLERARVLKQYNACLNVLAFGSNGLRAHVINEAHDPPGAARGSALIP